VAGYPMPDIPPGNLLTLMEALHALHARAGWPSTRQMAQAQEFSHTAVHDLFTKTDTAAPRLPVLLAVVAYLVRLDPRRLDVDAEIDRFDAMWQQALAKPVAERMPKPKTEAQPQPKPAPLVAPHFFKLVYNPRIESLSDPLPYYLQRLGFSVDLPPLVSSPGRTTYLLRPQPDWPLAVVRRALRETAMQEMCVFQDDAIYISVEYPVPEAERLMDLERDERRWRRYRFRFDQDDATTAANCCKFTTEAIKRHFCIQTNTDDVLVTSGQSFALNDIQASELDELAAQCGAYFVDADFHY
jgi:hypothetical protein